MSAKWLPPDDLAPAKPEGPRALELASHLIRFDPSDFGSPETDHGGATCYEALREEARLNVLVFLFKPIAQFAVPVQPRAAWGLELNLGIVQREKLVHTVPRIEELDPSTRDPHVFLRHHPRSISRKLFCFAMQSDSFHEVRWVRQRAVRGARGPRKRVALGHRFGTDCEPSRLVLRTPRMRNPRLSGAFEDGASGTRTRDLLIAKRDAMARHDVAFVALSSGVLPVEPRI